MNFEETYRYARDADTVMRMFSDRAYFERKYERTTLSYEVLEHERSDDHFRIRCKLTMPSHVPLPGFAKKVLGETMTVVQEDVWDLSTRKGQLKIEMHGAPISINAEMSLEQGENGGENHVQWQINSRVPLIGGKIAKLVADDIQAKSPGDVEISNELLAEY